MTTELLDMVKQKKNVVFEKILEGGGDFLTTETTEETIKRIHKNKIDLVKDLLKFIKKQHTYLVKK